MADRHPLAHKKNTQPTNISNHHPTEGPANRLASEPTSDQANDQANDQTSDQANKHMAPDTASGNHIDINLVEVDHTTDNCSISHQTQKKQTPYLSKPAPGNHIRNQSLTFSEHPLPTVLGTNTEHRELDTLIAKILYLEKQIHENNRDITMLSDNLAKLRETNRLHHEQHAVELQSEKDKALFFETRLAAEIDKLARIEFSLDQKGFTLDHLAKVIARCEELETKLAEDVTK